MNLENLLTVSSTPRNRLLADVLQKTGIVERSGQGVDKIFYQTLSEGKKEPDYSCSDDFQVELRLSTIIEDKAFALFIQSVQTDLDDKNKLSVFEIIALNNIRKGEGNYGSAQKDVLKILLDRHLIEMVGKTKGAHYILSKAYFEFTDEKGKYSKNTDWDENQVFLIILKHLQKFEQAKMNDFIDLFDGRLTRKQVRYSIDKLVEKKDLQRKGKGKGTIYSFGENFVKTVEILSKALDIGLRQMKDNGEILDNINWPYTIVLSTILAGYQQVVGKINWP